MPVGISGGASRTVAENETGNFGQRRVSNGRYGLYSICTNETPTMTGSIAGRVRLAGHAELRGTGYVLAQVNFADNFLDLAALCRTHKCLARKVRAGTVIAGRRPF